MDVTCKAITLHRIGTFTTLLSAEDGSDFILEYFGEFVIKLAYLFSDDIDNADDKHVMMAFWGTTSLFYCLKLMILYISGRI